MLKLKVFINKNGKKTYALILQTELKEYYIGFDVGMICDVMDVTPSTLARYDVGEYKKGE